MWGGDRIPEIDDERTSQHDEFGSLTGFLTREADGEPFGVGIRGLIKPLERREPCKGSVTPVTLREVARLRVQNGWFWARNGSKTGFWELATRRFRGLKWPPTAIRDRESTPRTEIRLRDPTSTSKSEIWGPKSIADPEIRLRDPTPNPESGILSSISSLDDGNRPSISNPRPEIRDLRVEIVLWSEIQ